MTKKTAPQSRWKRIQARRNPDRPPEHVKWEDEMRILCPSVFGQGPGEKVLALMIDRFVLEPQDLNASESALRLCAAIGNFVLELERYTREGPIDAPGTGTRSKRSGTRSGP